jgi:hypothetical protein
MPKPIPPLSINVDQASCSDTQRHYPLYFHIPNIIDKEIDADNVQGRCLGESDFHL